jgi:hypothetical protein
MKILIRHLFVILFLCSSCLSNAQNNISTEGGKQSLLGTLVFNKKNEKLYLLPLSCEMNRLYEFKVDQLNYLTNTPFTYGKKLKENILNYELTRLENLDKRVAMISKNNLNSFQDKIQLYFKDEKMIYIDKNFYPNKIENSIDGFTQTMDGLFKLEFGNSFKIYYKPTNNSEVIEIFNLPIDKINQSNFCSFSYDIEYSKLTSISVKENDGFIIYIYDPQKKVMYPEISSKNSFNYITTKLNLFNTQGSATMNEIAKDMIPRLYTYEQNQVFVKYFTEKPKKKKSFFGELMADMGEGLMEAYGNNSMANNQKDELKNMEGVYPTLEYESMSKDIWTYIEKGGINNYNDSLVELTATYGFQFSGSISEDGETFLINSMPSDPSGKLKDFLTAKFDYTSLYELCPNKPELVSKMATLNNDLIAIEKKANLENAKIRRYSFTSEEIKDSSGLTYTNVKVLKDCKNFDLSNNTEGQVLKELINSNNKNLGVAIANLTSLSAQYLVINSQISGCMMNVDTKGLDDRYSTLVNRVSSGGMKTILLFTMSKVDKTLNSLKNSKLELENAKNVLESYKKSY